jgi:hypothetical protein
LPQTIVLANLKEPTQKQAENFIHNTLKSRLLIKSSFNYGELFDYAERHSNVPVLSDDSYCIDSFFNINDKFPETSIFRISISTKHLLSIAMLTNHVCTDTTHKVMWHGFPVFIAGKLDI